MTVNRQPYTMTLTPGRNAESCAARAARYVIDRWLPNNAGGIHLMVTPRLASAFGQILNQASAAGESEVRVRVEIQGNIPVLTLLAPAVAADGRR